MNNSRQTRDIWTKVEDRIWQDNQGRFHSLAVDGQTWLSWDLKTARENRAKDAATALACALGGDWEGMKEALHPTSATTPAQERQP